MAALDTLVSNPSGRQCLTGLQAWDIGQRQRLAPVFAQRKSAGMVRECHGDLHGGNILTTERGVEAFDCIEFSEALRWIDVMNDLAFICMDLAFRQRRDLSARLRNQYLALTGDYEGLAVLRYYDVHRALVRSMVFLMQAGQAQSGSHAAACGQQGLAYLAYASDAARPATPAILITHGYSGSGKTTFSRLVVEVLGAVQLRSDVERKRMHGLTADDRSGSRPGSALYDAAASERTYTRLLELARTGVAAGFVVMVDAAFLASAQRACFARCAGELGIPFFLFDIQASAAAMEQRLAARAAAGTDASDAAAAVLAHQLATAEPLSAAERMHAIVVDAEAGIDRAAVVRWCRPVADAIAMPLGEPAAGME
jgi:predicted kinase